MEVGKYARRKVSEVKGLMRDEMLAAGDALSYSGACRACCAAQLAASSPSPAWPAARPTYACSHGQHCLHSLLVTHPELEHQHDEPVLAIIVSGVSSCSLTPLQSRRSQSCRGRATTVWWR